MPEVNELAQYQQSTDALAPLVADQGTWFDQEAPQPPRAPKLQLVPRGSEVWLLSPFSSTLATLVQPEPLEPPRPLPLRLGAPALELRPLGQSSPVGVLGWELAGLRPPPLVLHPPAGEAMPMRALQDSTPLRSTLDQPTARGPAGGVPPRPLNQELPLGPGIVLPLGWESPGSVPRQPPTIVRGDAAFPLGPGIVLPFGWDPQAAPPRAPAAIPRPAPLASPPGALIPLSVAASTSWEPRGAVPPRVPWIPRVEQADPPGNFLLPPAASTGWEPQGLGPRPVPKIARFELASPVGSPLVVLGAFGWDSQIARDLPLPPRTPILAGDPVGALMGVLGAFGWDPGSPRPPQDPPPRDLSAGPIGPLILGGVPWAADAPAARGGNLVLTARPLAGDVLAPLAGLAPLGDWIAPLARAARAERAFRGADPTLLAPLPLLAGFLPQERVVPGRFPSGPRPAPAPDLGTLLPPPAVRPWFEVVQRPPVLWIRYPGEFLYQLGAVGSALPVPPPTPSFAEVDFLSLRDTPAEVVIREASPVNVGDMPDSYAIQGSPALPLGLRLQEADGSPIKIEFPVSVVVRPADRSRRAVVTTATVADAPGGAIVHSWTDEELRWPGLLLVQLQWVDPTSGKPRIFPRNRYVTVLVSPNLTKM